MFRIVSALVCVFASSCVCDPVDLPQGPIIDVDACKTAPPHEEGHVEDCELRFDSIPSTQTVHVVEVNGGAPLHFVSVELTNGTFSLEHGVPDESDGAIDVTASSRQANATLRIVSNAINAQRQPDGTSLVEVALIVH